MSLRIIVTTFAKDIQASKVSQPLLKSRLAACVKLIPVKSSYWWNGRIRKSGEVMMIITTDSKVSGRVISLIRKLHPYDVPEIVELHARVMEKSYMEWVKNVTKQ